MSDDPQSTALAVREATSAGVPLPPMDDHELSALWRTAKALAESRLFKDAMQAGQAFAKILAGRDLGLTPFEAMSALHVIDGKVEASSDLHATRLRERSGLDFRVAWLKVDEPEDWTPGANAAKPTQVTAVWADEEELEDLRETFGAVVVIYEHVPEGGRAQDGSQRGVSRFTYADAQTAGLIKDRSGWANFPRNMLYARAMTNAVGWFVPEIMGGVRVYGHGEIDRGAGGDDLTSGAGAGAAAAPVEDLPTEATAIIARARELGHVGLQNPQGPRYALEQGPEAFERWCRSAAQQLNRLARARDHGEPDPPEAEVVEPKPQEGDLPSDPAQTSDPTPEGHGAPDASPEPSETRRAIDVAEHALEQGVDETLAAARGEWSLEDRIASAEQSMREAEDAGDDQARNIAAQDLAALRAQQSAAANPDQAKLI